MLRKKRKIKKNAQIKNKNNSRYTSRSYNNPFFKKKAKRKAIFPPMPLKVKIIALFICLLVVFLLWFFFLSGFFVIKNVQIEGGVRVDGKVIENIARKQLRDYSYMFISQKNIFNFDEERLKEELLKTYAFDYLEVNKKFPDTLIIKLQEKEYAMVWVEGEILYYVDEKGYVVVTTSREEIEGKDYPVVENLTQLLIEDNYIGLNKDYLPVLFKFYSLFKDHSDDFALEKFVIEEGDSSIKAFIDNGPAVYFSMTEDAENQMKKLLVAKNDIIKDNFSSIEYINVKIGDSVYYR